MKLYKIAWGDYDAYEPIVLLHNREFVQDEFEQMVKEATKSVLESTLRKEDEFIGFCNELLEHISEILQTKYGFEPAIYSAEHEFQGNHIIRKRGVGSIAEFINDKNLVEKIITHNEKVNKRTGKIGENT